MTTAEFLHEATRCSRERPASKTAATALTVGSALHEPPQSAYEEQDALRERGREEIEERVVSLKLRLLFDEIARVDESAVATAPGTGEGRFWRSLSSSLWAEAEEMVPNPEDLYTHQMTALLRKAAREDEWRA
ncbi:hypothetical protein GBA65_07120 [Rubrobacter marinus]|uniref:Uncharacterized protein n=1 Tax=Rubrobacter marinus TaxID=2653852 RepID=A0A6G8PVV3_9ACTN|nr:hypothetical protein [Rubrobacter marinus]QIN78326.1 hypothetical protein GBA65_07120 [Rubrobacter marinus]